MTPSATSAPATSQFWRDAVVAQCAALDASGQADAADVLRGARAPRIGARRRHAVRHPVRPAAAHLRDWLSSRRRRRSRAARRRRSTICWRRRRGSASFVAIAKGDVPQHHWFHLGRLGHQRPRPRDADVVGRHDVRVPDAAAADAHVPGTLLDQSCRVPRAAPDRVRRGSAACRGASRNRRMRSPIAPATISTAPSACPGWA